ncbi:MAG: glycosyltransferase, partial [Planctomycetota bacterium]
AEFDVSSFGGPWATQLGLDARPARVPPFEVTARAACEGSRDADLTVLIPSYQHEDYIASTMRSVLGQTLDAFQLLVVDDRSPDATVARARAVTDPRVEVRVNEENLGLGNSVLAALESIDTPYVALLNSDDLLHPERLARCRELLEQDPDAMLVTTDLALIDGQDGVLTPENVSLVLDGKQVHDWVHWYRDALAEAEGAHESPIELFTALLRKNFLATSSNLVARRSWLLQQAQALQSLKYCLDWQLFLEAALEGSLRHIAEPLAAYRLHATNTVWFQQGQRWSYYLEVNRVATEALLRFHARGEGGAKLEQLRRTLTALTRGLARNNETDGLAMLLNALVDRVGLERSAEEDEATRALVQELAALSSPDLAPPSTDQDARRPRHAMHRSLLQALLQRARDDADGLQAQLISAQFQLQNARDDRERLETEKRALYEDQRARIAAAQQLEQDKRALYADQKERIAQAEQQTQRIAELHQDQQERIAQAEQQTQRIADLHQDQKERIERAREQDQRIRDLYQDQKERVTATRRLEEEKKALYRDQKQRIERAQQQEQRLRELYADQKERIERAAELQRALDTASSDLTQARATSGRLETDLEARTAQVERLSHAKRGLEEQLRQLRGELARVDQQVTTLLGSPEYRLGHYLWNKSPIGYMARTTKNWFQRLFGAKDSATTTPRPSETKTGTAVVAACWQWPIYSHTFVYQEMISLGATGLDVQLFHWDLTDTGDLHAAFEYLNQNRTLIQPNWDQHKQNKAHLEQAYPGKLRSFLERIAPLVDKTADELEEEPIVMQACTFTRQAELAGARYLHSYFFYDQSFMAMLAAWVLDLPRGVSCYADHMMDDYAFKLVPLHVELADVIVATSARIKQELSELSGGHWDDKIVVKPNGVDGERFPARARPARSEDEPFEVISVSRIEPKKGLTHLVEAVAELKKRGHTVIAHIIGAKDPNSAGSLEYSDAFEQCIRDHGLEDQVILHGMMKQEQMPPIIEKSRAFVAPYVETESGDKDGIPTAMLEALASSLPIITTDSGSITEVVDDGVEGFVVAQRDSAAFADALEKVITDAALERRLADAARARFDRDFDIKVTERRLHERVRGFLAQKSRS